MHSHLAVDVLKELLGAVAPEEHVGGLKVGWHAWTML
jgi:hypothetical protein